MHFRRRLTKLREHYTLFKKGYFSLLPVLLLSVLMGWSFALFPYNDLSLAYMFTYGVRIVMLEAAAAIFILVLWVMVVSYRLDLRNGWHERWSRRLLLQFLRGGVLQIVVMLGYVYFAYGEEVLMGVYMQFIYALYILFLFALNSQGYMVYLLEKLTALKTQIGELRADIDRITAENHSLKLKCDAADEQIAFLQNQISPLKKEITDHIQLIVSLKENLARKEALIESYEITPPKKHYTFRYSSTKIYEFAEDEIAAFFVEGSANKKPLINIRAKNGTQLLTAESNLTALERQFDTLIRLTRQYLVSPDVIVHFREVKEGGAWVTLDFSSEPIEVKKQKWKTIGAQIRNIVVKNKKTPNPSPDALI